MAKLQSGRAIGGGHETPSGAALSGDGVFKLLNVVDDRCEVGATDGVDRTDAETGALEVGEGRCVGGPAPGGVAVHSTRGQQSHRWRSSAYAPAELKTVPADLHDNRSSQRHVDRCRSLWIASAHGTRANADRPVVPTRLRVQIISEKEHGGTIG